MQRNHSPQLQVARDVSEVEGVHDLVRDLLAEDLVCLDDAAVEAVGAQALVEVARLYGVSDVRESETLVRTHAICSC